MIEGDDSRVGEAPDTMQAGLWIGAGTCVLLTLVAILAERRRSSRRDPDRVGIMPWTAIQMASILGSVMCAALALTSR